MRSNVEGRKFRFRRSAKKDPACNTVYGYDGASILPVHTAAIHIRLAVAKRLKKGLNVAVRDLDGADVDPVVSGAPGGGGAVSSETRLSLRIYPFRNDLIACRVYVAHVRGSSGTCVVVWISIHTRTSSIDHHRSFGRSQCFIPRGLAPCGQQCQN